jgi:hypothetical protein
LSAADGLYSRAVSIARQPIESLFNWLQEKTNIHKASKIRSSEGLISFIYSRLIAAFFVIIIS